MNSANDSSTSIWGAKRWRATAIATTSSSASEPAVVQRRKTLVQPTKHWTPHETQLFLQELALYGQGQRSGSSAPPLTAPTLLTSGLESEQAPMIQPSMALLLLRQYWRFDRAALAEQDCDATQALLSLANAALTLSPLPSPPPPTTTARELPPITPPVFDFVSYRAVVARALSASPSLSPPPPQ